MQARIARRLIFLLALLAAGGGLAWNALERRRAGANASEIIGVVRETEIRIAAEKGGRLGSIAVAPGQGVRTGDLLAVLDSPELAASVEETRAAEKQARADRDNVLAGVRNEQIDTAEHNVRIAEANIGLGRKEYERTRVLAGKNVASQQKLDEATASLRRADASLEQAQAFYRQLVAGATAEERAKAEAEFALARAKTADIEAVFAKTRVLSPVDGVVGVLVATPGEVVSPGQAIMTLNAPARRWFSFTVREDRLGGLAIGSKTTVAVAGHSVAGRVTELRPLGEFATWRAARAVGDHDLNSFLVRVDPETPDDSIEPGMTVRLAPAGSR
ncbi:efflux RND transporter periplasmic adaptor subunit [uncultured Rhodoblastus sp.]|uniref:HlyD family secretion protein n=1 Tax=uncultured Rhodoblastus sp. TaxID=543037 RepID=UPI0025DAEE3C|nr:efflux RND transporter periplasmic adaptor subunit [uncultured Rhodoblastus sp.]